MTKSWNGDTTLNKGLLHFRGSVGDNVFHAHAALQIVLGSNCIVHHADFAKQAAPLYIRPMVKHRLEASDEVEIFLIEPSSKFGQSLIGSLPVQAIGALDLGLLDTLRRSGDTSELLSPALRRALIFLSGPDALQRRVADASQKAGVSTSRLRALSQSALGVSLSRWRLWQALQTALEELAAGKKPADAAYAAGFSDQAHLTRRMKASLGLTPGQVLESTGMRMGKRFVQDE